MNILVVSSKYPPEYSGSGHRAHNTYMRLKSKYGISFDALVNGVTGDQRSSYVWDGIRVRRIAKGQSAPRRPSRATRRFKRLLQALRYRLQWQYFFLREAVPALFFLFRRASNYDLIHVFGNSPVTAAAVIYAKIKRKPLIVELVNLKDNPHLYEPALIRYLFGPGFPSWALIVCLSEYLYRICRKFGYSRNQLWCRPNPIDEKRFNLSPPRTSVPEIRQHFQKTDILILHLAKFIPRKHQKFMIDVLALLPERYKLVLAGPLVNAGPLRERDQAYYQSIRSAIMNTGLQDRVAIVPEFIEHPEEYMKACDVFVLPSEDEAFGTPFLEAIACGKPAVVNDIPGVFDLWVRPGINGFICQLDPELWAKCIQKAFAIPQETRNRASRRILRKASTETIDQIYIDRIHLLTNSPLGKRTAF